MSAESFYFCSDLAQVETWWRQPIGQTFGELSRWQRGDRSEHALLIDEEDMRQVVLPALEVWRGAAGTAQSLGQASRLAVDRLIAGSQGRLGSLAESALLILRPSFVPKDYRDLSQLSELYIALVQAARSGPVNAAANARVTDEYFPKFLELFMSPSEAAQYNGSHPADSQRYCSPAELDIDEIGPRLPRRSMLPMLRAMLGHFPLVLDAETWRRKWERLEQIPDLWKLFETDLASSLAKEKASEYAAAIAAHLRDIGSIARYAAEENMAMLKTVA